MKSAQCSKDYVQGCDFRFFVVSCVSCGWEMLRVDYLQQIVFHDMHSSLRI